MLRVRVCAAHMDGFLGQNSLDKGAFFSSYPIDMSGMSRNWQKIAKNGSFSTKFQVGMMANFGN